MRRSADVRSTNVLDRTSFLVGAEQVPGLVLTAQTEIRVSSFNPGRPPVASPGNASALSESTSILLQTSDKEQTWKEDAFQAKICAAWIDRTLEKTESVLKILPSSPDILLEQLSKDESCTQKSTHVCLVRAAHFRGNDCGLVGAPRQH